MRFLQTTIVAGQCGFEALVFNICANLFLFLLTFVQFQYKLKKRRCCSWDSNPGLQNCRCRWSQCALMAKTLVGPILLYFPLFCNDETTIFKNTTCIIPCEMLERSLWLNRFYTYLTKPKRRHNPVASFQQRISEIALQYCLTEPHVWTRFKILGRISLIHLKIPSK